ncbi:MAG TPA: queuosine salvage family protein [Solirubrobacterales bacterium]
MAGIARRVAVVDDAIEPYAASLPDPPRAYLEVEHRLGAADRETRTAFVICLDAINFGSGWWPTIRKRDGHSGYSTIESALAERFRDAGHWPVEQLREVGPAEIAAALGQDAGHPLMASYAEALRDVGDRVAAEHSGSFTALVGAARGSAVELAGILAGWRSFADVSLYEGEQVPFYKRAQIAAADLNRAGVASLAGEERLTAFADNLVPHVLRLDGVLHLDPPLAAAIDAGELLIHGSPEEVELRACAVHAVERISAADAGRLAPASIDAILWSRGGGARYKAVPRPRSRNTAY